MEEVQSTVRKELRSPERLLGFGILQNKVREVHEPNVPHDLVCAVLGEENPEGLAARGGVGKPKRPPQNRVFVTGVSSRSVIVEDRGHHNKSRNLCIDYENAIFR